MLFRLQSFGPVFKLSLHSIGFRYRKLSGSGLTTEINWRWLPLRSLWKLNYAIIDEKRQHRIPELSCEFDSQFCSTWSDPEWKKCDSEDATSLRQTTNFKNIKSFLDHRTLSPCRMNNLQTWKSVYLSPGPYCPSMWSSSSYLWVIKNDFMLTRL